MSALTTPLDDFEVRSTPRSQRPALRQVVQAPMRVSRVVFVAVLTLVLGAGMVGVLLLNTTIQERQTRVTAAQRQADDLAWTNATLTTQVEQLRSSSDLANRAWAMGMRPNPYPVFVQLGADGKPGKVLGTPQAVSGSEMGNQNYANADVTAQQIDKTHADAVAKKKAAAAAARAKYQAELAARKAAAKAKAEQAAAKAKAEQAAAKAKADQAAAKAKAAQKAANSTGGR